jgi:hypothetical protein
VDVVGLGVYVNGYGFEAIEGSAHIRVEVCFQFVREARFTMFGRENKMNINFREGLWHNDLCGAPSGRDPFV